MADDCVKRVRVAVIARPRISDRMASDDAVRRCATLMMMRFNVWLSMREKSVMELADGSVIRVSDVMQLQSSVLHTLNEWFP
jgi:site-specific recombinase XerC